MTPVIALSVTVASVVATQVMRSGNAAASQPRACSPPQQVQGGASPQVSDTCSLHPGQEASRFAPHRASGSWAKAILIRPARAPPPPPPLPPRLPPPPPPRP